VPIAVLLAFSLIGVAHESNPSPRRCRNMPFLSYLTGIWNKWRARGGMGAVGSGELTREGADCSLRARIGAAQQALKDGQRGRERENTVVTSRQLHHSLSMRGQGTARVRTKISAAPCHFFSSSCGTPSVQEHNDRTCVTCATARPSTNQQRACLVSLPLPQQPGQPERRPQGRMMSGCARPTWLAACR
jgi:hypothetical protein